MCSWEGLLDFENEEYVFFYLLSGQGPASSLTPGILEYLSTGEKLQLFTLGPIYPLPHRDGAGVQTTDFNPEICYIGTGSSRTLERYSAGPPMADPGHFHTVLHHPGPLLGHHAQVPEAGGDDALGHTVELGDSGMDGWCHVLISKCVFWDQMEPRH